jgi:hypothetical protein
VRDEAEDLLARAAASGAVLLPVAMDAERRLPPAVASDRQSFDVVDHLRRRELADDQLAVVGAAFAREALSLTMPTYAQSRLRLFLCHRREDGEEVSARLDSVLSRLHEWPFRDLIDVQSGQRAQQRIDDALAGADVLVFIDTPKAGESWWVARELATALGRAIPIVWVQLGAAACRAPLRVRPEAEPHIVIDEGEIDAASAGALADEILQVAARLARQHMRMSKRALHDLKRWASEHRAEVTVLDARRQVFQVRHPLPAERRRYPLREATDIVQFFGRVIRDSDRRRLEEFLLQRGMGPHDQECRAFDAAIMLDPTAGAHRTHGEWSVTEHPTAFLTSLQTTRPAAPNPPRLVLVGAHPGGDLARDQIAPAVAAAAVTWLAAGGTIVCGGHPTFVPLLVEAARAERGEDARDALVVFWSEWYAAPAQVRDLEHDANVVVTPAGDTRDSSLTIMRERMIADGAGQAVLAIGGRTEERGSHTPGIDEEIRLARAAGLPVYLLGAPGGQAALIAAREAAASLPWSGLGNHLDADSNKLLRDTDAYEDAVRRIWDVTA